MSNTPRTDDAHLWHKAASPDCDGVDSDFARTLERELSCMTHQRDALLKELRTAQRDAATEQRWADRADAEGVPHGTY